MALPKHYWTEFSSSIKQILATLPTSGASICMVKNDEKNFKIVKVPILSRICEAHIKLLVIHDIENSTVNTQQRVEKQ